MPIWLEPCHLPESEFVSSSCHTPWCPIARACSNSAIWVPSSVSHGLSISYTKSMFPLPVHSSYQMMASQVFIRPFPNIFDKYFSTVHFPGIFMYLQLLPHLMHRHLLAGAHHSVYCVISSFFLTVFLPSACALHSPSILPPNSESWLHTARLHKPLLTLVELSLLSFPPDNLRQTFLLLLPAHPHVHCLQ